MAPHMPEIVHVNAREILDSRGNPTVECEIETASGPLAARQSRAEPPPENTRPWSFVTRTRNGYLGKGVRTAVANINDKLGPAVSGLSCLDQTAVDQRLLELDGTPNKTKLGANAILGVSMAAARAGAEVVGLHSGGTSEESTHGSCQRP